MFKEVPFSIDSYFSYYLSEPVRYEFEQDRVIDYNHEVRIDLQHSIGRYVKLQLAFDAKWLMISEVQFESGRWRMCVTLLTNSVRSHTSYPFHFKRQYLYIKGSKICKRRVTTAVSV